MKEYFYDFLLMIQILTRVPIKKSLPCIEKNFKDGANFFAFIGFLIGITMYAVYFLMSKIIHVNFVVIALIIFEVVITGAMHIDGFGDTCDGFFAFKGKDKYKVMEIMKDSRIGTFGCIAIVLNLLIKYVGFSLLISNYNSLYIILIPMISRFSMVLLSFIGKPAKENGIGNWFINIVTLKEIAVNTVFILIIGALLNAITKTIIFLILAIIITFLFNFLCNHKIGGVTGDTLGANNELVALFSLIICQSI